MKEEELRHAKAAGLALQGGWIRWESVEPRALTWSNIWSMEPMLFRFTIRATYDVLPSPTNLSIWGLSNDNKCVKCQQRGTLQHILCACPKSLASGLYTWRHNQVLEVIGKELETIIKKFNSLPTSSSAGHAPIPFIKEGAKPRQSKPPPPRGILASANDWEIRLDLNSRLYFPPDIIITDMRPDLIIWSKLRKIVIIGELTVPWEDNIDERNEYKRAKYQELVSDIKARGWTVHCFPFEVGCRGFTTNSLCTFVSRLGAGSRIRKSVMSKASEAASRGSAWVWSKYLAAARVT